MGEAEVYMETGTFPSHECPQLEAALSLRSLQPYSFFSAAHVEIPVRIIGLAVAEGKRVAPCLHDLDIWWQL